MTKRITIKEVSKLEEEFHKKGCNPNEYLLITTQLKVDIENNYKRQSREFKHTAHSSIKKLKTQLKTDKTFN